jgi:branched-chain amino acid transport system permease protein
MVIEILIIGLTLGAIYALIAIGYSMVYGILRLMNFAHGDTYTFGSFICYMLLVKYNVNPILSILIAMGVGGVLASAVELLAYRPLRAPEFRNVSMISALGVAYIIQNSSENFWGSQVHLFPSIISTRFFTILGTQIPTTQFLTLAITLAAIMSLNLFLKYHKIGKSIICISQDIPTSSLMGIRINKTISFVYFLGGILGVLAAVLYESSYNVLSIKMGFSGTINAFNASVLGGIGSMNGALLGGLILGLIHSLAGVYVSTTFRDVITFVILIFILLLRPQGILGQYIEEKV